MPGNFCFPFCDLPPEIRLLIWEATLPGPRHVGPSSSIQGHLHRPQRRLGAGFGTGLGVGVAAAPPGTAGPASRRGRQRFRSDPVTLRVNRESRAVALSRYIRRDSNVLKSWAIVTRDVQHVSGRGLGHGLGQGTGIGRGDDEETCCCCLCCSYLDYRANVAAFYSFSYLFDAEVHAENDGHAPGWRQRPRRLSFFSDAKMARIQRVRIVHDGITSLATQLLHWMQIWMPLFVCLDELIIKVRGLTKCRGFVTPTGAFLTVEQALGEVGDLAVEQMRTSTRQIEQDMAEDMEGEGRRSWHGHGPEGNGSGGSLKQPLLRIVDGGELNLERRWQLIRR